MVDDEDRKALSAQEGYQYYPQTIYESIPAKIEAPGLPIPERRIKEEYPGPAGLASGWTGGGCGRFQGMETSRGLYPDMQAHLGY
jgi:meiosis-specific transcription factor NDT80